jgi:glycerol-3-phosphate dehydrogenase (NAD(P)+)
MNIQIVGGGSWGLALARVVANNGHNVRLWCRQEDDPDTLRETRESKPFLPGVHIPESVDVDPDGVDADADIAVMAVPSHIMRKAAGQFAFSAKTVRVSVAKGIENETLRRMSEVIHEVQGDEIAVVALSGPSHAEEVAHDLPASLVAAGANEGARKLVQEAFMAKTFRVYTSPDIIGVELGGSLKNVMALAAGVSDGFGLGDNAKAALVTRGLHEMSRIGAALGADPLTFAGLSGMGDLIVTCMSQHSRNHRVGERIAKGESLEDILGGMIMVAEGVRTAKSARELAHRENVEMPISEQVCAVLFDKADPKDAVWRLMEREAKPERH